MLKRFLCRIGWHSGGKFQGQRERESLLHEVERLREALDAAEKVVQAARGDQFGLERRMEEYDKLKEVE